MTVITACHSKHYHCVSTEWSHMWSLSQQGGWIAASRSLICDIIVQIYSLCPSLQTTRLSSAVHIHRISPQDWRWLRVYSSADKSLTGRTNICWLKLDLLLAAAVSETIWLLNHFCLRLYCASEHFMRAPATDSRNRISLRASKHTNSMSSSLKTLNRLTRYYATRRGKKHCVLGRMHHVFDLLENKKYSMCTQHPLLTCVIFSVLPVRPLQASSQTLITPQMDPLSLYSWGNLINASTWCLFFTWILTI